jgi:hypothetical protein
MERRRAPRRAVVADEPLCHARLRTGGQLRLVDVSGCGALVETTERLLPGRHLDAHVVSVEGRVLVRSRVARAFVWRLEADAIHYRAALAFDRSIDIRADGYAVPVAFRPPEIEPGNRYPDSAAGGDIEFAEPLSA